MKYAFYHTKAWMQISFTMLSNCEYHQYIGITNWPILSCAGIRSPRVSWGLIVRRRDVFIPVCIYCYRWLPRPGPENNTHSIYRRPIHWYNANNSLTTRPTLKRRLTRGRLRYINPDMINHFASPGSPANQRPANLFFKHWNEILNIVAFSGWTDEDQFKFEAPIFYSSCTNNHLYIISQSIMEMLTYFHNMSLKKKIMWLHDY